MTDQHSFSKRLSKNIVGIINVLFVIAALSTFLMFGSVLRRNSNERADLLLKNVTIELSGQLKEVEAIVKEESWYFQHDRSDSAYMIDVIGNIVKEYPHLLGGAVAFNPSFLPEGTNPSVYVGIDGDKLYSTPVVKEGYNYLSLEWYKVPVETGHPYWTSPYFDEGLANKYMTTYCYPLKNDSGEVYAVLTADVSMDWLTDHLETIKPYPHGYVTLVNTDGTFISRPPVEGVTTETTVASLLQTSEYSSNEAEDLQNAMVAGQSGMNDIKAGKYHLTITYGPLYNKWSIAVVCPMIDIYRDMNRLSISMMVIVLLSLILLYWIINRIIKHESQPIVEFTYSAKNIAKGNFHAVIPEVKTKDELKNLQESLSYMQRSINDYMSELKTSTAANERYENELTIARSLQLAMVPTNFPIRNDVGIYARLQPAREVGGDLYDFTALDNRFYFAIGDVSGKGVPAALVMAICRSSVRFVSGLGLKLSDVVSRVNNVLCDGNETGMFVTMIVGRLNIPTGNLELCNAGHNPMVVVPPRGNPYYYKAKANLATGLFEDFQYQGEELQIEKGTRLILYTDGVTEAENMSKDQYGEDRLLDFARNIAPGTPDHQVVDDLYASVKAFTKDNEQNDDITVLSFTYNG